MENSIWNGQLLIASDIAKEYALEKKVRKASGDKGLRCPDSDCQEPILRYCHGEVKDAYFAHLSNARCDYAEFDKINIQIVRKIKKILYEHFKENGYKVQLEVKIIDHHYTHLLFELPDGKTIAVEIGTQQLSKNRMDNINEKYKSKGIAVKWIVICDTKKIVQENHTYFLKRYLLNESKNKDLLVISQDGLEIAQYKSDPNRYEYNGRLFESENYENTYRECSPLTSLTFEDNELSLKGFIQRYNTWLNKKQKAFNKKIAKLEEEKQRYIKLKQLQAQKKSNDSHEQKNHDIKAHHITPTMVPYKSDNIIIQSKDYTISSQPDMSYEQRRLEILPFIDQQETQALDSFGEC